VLLSVFSPGITFAPDDALPSVYQFPTSEGGVTPKEIMDGDNTTCIQIPSYGQPPQELGVRLDGHGPLRTLALHGDGIQCDESHVVAMSLLTNSRYGLSKLCTLAVGTEDCRVSCSVQLSLDEFSVLISLSALEGINARLCEVIF
ncbi:hypothetical protein CAPTEDRAFT_196705, partial [Capitella teleta]